MNYYIQGSSARAKEIKAAFEAKGCTLYRLISQCDSEDLIYYSLNGRVRCIKKDNLYLFEAHPGYTKLELPVEPKFKVGDWLVYKDGATFCGGFKTVQVQAVEKDRYIFTHGTRSAHRFIDSECRLWTIADAAPSDVITNGKLIVIFNKLEEPAYKQHIIAYAGLDLCGRLQITEDTWQLGVDKAMPATKEQCDLLFQKIKEAGYEWDAEKKELRKIKPHYDIANFKPKQWVLVRNYDNQVWGLSMFSHRDMGCYICINRVDFTQCIPFNEDTKHLVGTTNPCDEQYINW